MQKNIETRKNQTKFIFLIILAICFLATGGIFVKLSAFPPITTGFYRVLFSIPLLFPFVIKEIKTIERKEYLLILLAGIFLAGDLILWNISFHYTTVANGNLLANLVPFTIIPVAHFVFKEKIPKRFLLGVLITLIGVGVLLSGKINPSGKNILGDTLAFLTSIFYALFLLCVYKLRDKKSAATIMFISAFSSALVLFLAMMIREKFVFPKTFSEFYPLVSLALISQILGQGLLSFCLGKVKVSLSSVIVLLQPVIAALYSFIIFREFLSGLEILGIGITLIGIYFAKKSA